MVHLHLKTGFLLMLLAIAPRWVFAQNPAAQREQAGWEAFEKAMNEKMQACVDEGRAGCARSMIGDWDKELNVVYKKLMTELDTAQQSALRSAQRAWLTYRGKEVAFLDARVDAMMEGTMGTDESDAAVLDVTRGRVEELHRHLMFELYRNE